MNLSTIIYGHALPSTNLEQRVVIGDEQTTIFGHGRRIIMLGKPQVILLSDESTPQKRSFHPQAEKKFETAAIDLVQDGVQFYTILRPGWSLPALYWTLHREE